MCNAVRRIISRFRLSDGTSCACVIANWLNSPFGACRARLPHAVRHSLAYGGRKEIEQEQTEIAEAEFEISVTSVISCSN